MITFYLNEIYDISACVYQMAIVPVGVPSRLLVVGRTKEFIKYVLVDNNGQAIQNLEKRAATRVNRNGIEYICIVNNDWCRADNYRNSIIPF